MRLLLQALLLLAISVFVMIQRGPTMCDPFFLLPLSLFSALLVGPILIEEYRKDENKSSASLVITAAGRASGAILLILAMSLALVNFGSTYGQLLLPTVETCAWTVVLSVTAALAGGAGLLFFRSGRSMNKLKWATRAIGLAAVLCYKYLPPGLSYSWYGIVLDWGITPSAFAFELMLVFIASASLLVLRRREQTLHPED